MEGDPARALDELRRRLAPLLEQAGPGRPALEARLEAVFEQLFAALSALYGHRWDFAWQLEAVLRTALEAALARPERLAARDRERRPDWIRESRQVGAMGYVDRFAGSIVGLFDRLPHLEHLGVTYLHLMPLFAVPDGPNDGGYAVSSYREVAPRLGSMAQLADLAAALHDRGMALVLDFVLNHTADDHAWAEAAKAGDPAMQAFYWMFDERGEVEPFARSLRQIFPDRGGDAFVWRDDVAGGKWVWSTFYPFQWDLNYTNPEVLRAILGEMLFLANQGVDVLRLDAVPFLWKKAGTPCENLPEAHLVVRAFNAAAAIAAPSLVFKSEAIVHPDEVARYVRVDECRLSYNPLLMCSLWDALATRDTRHLRDVLARRLRTAEGTAWVNYLRCHDDIGWGMADEDMTELGIAPEDHRRFLNAFYTGRFPGSFARGLPFQENPRTGDCRVSGTCAALAGLEQAEELGDATLLEHAVRRIVLLHGLVYTMGGIPLLYLGDEIAQPNDPSYTSRPAEAADNRWVHRPFFDDARLQRALAEPATPAGRVLEALVRLKELRRSEPALAVGPVELLELDPRYTLAYRKRAQGRSLTVVANLCEHEVDIEAGGLGPGPFLDLWGGRNLEPARLRSLEAYGLLVLRRDG
ncbi:MAG TPA: amylosucrase [Geminicoccaceae bacterium]|jgi:glycosidase|nr:amylosucrase [Geminicoccaceae bacterium]